MLPNYEAWYTGTVSQLKTNGFEEVFMGRYEN